MSAPTQAELRELAARARTLANDIDATYARLRAAPDEPTRRVGFRLHEAASSARDQVADEIDATAGDLARVRGRGDCPADWGVCPDHGNTLISSGGESWCREPGCGRRWGYDRGGLPCAEPAEFEVRDTAGGGGPMCAGHAMAARAQLDGATVTPLSAGGAR